LFAYPHDEDNATRLERIAHDTPVQSINELAGIRLATLIMVNRNDPVHPFEYGGILANAIPNAQLREIRPKSEGESQHAADVQRCVSEFLKAKCNVIRKRP
jgi:pimeloyl-ACP methyl ester carboxylesterase